MEIIKDKVHYLMRKYFRIKKIFENGSFIMDEDWDNLIILDACRFDTFKEVTGHNVDHRISLGSNTGTFLKENFENRTFKNTIYITTNPYVNRICRKSFYKVISLWKNEWNEEIGTVLPETVVNYAVKIEKKYPDKRLIIHFLQPHSPYLKDLELIQYGTIRLDEGIKVSNPILAVEEGVLSLDRVYRAYRRNLEAVMPHANYLVKNLTGKSVITADHGEGFGEWAFPFPVRIFGHPPHVHIPALVKVPWSIFDRGERKEIKKGEVKKELKEKINKVVDVEKL